MPGSAMFLTKFGNSGWTRVILESYGPATTARGRTSTPTTATRRSAVPRAPTAKAATGCRPLPGCPEKSKRAQRITTSLVDWIFMATFAALAGVKLPEKDRDGQPMMFDSYDMAPLLFGTGKWPRETWDYFTENELLPGAVRWHNIKFVMNLRGDDGTSTGGLAVDSNLGWKGAEKYIATVPQVFDLWADPQERYDIFMNSFTERTWLAPVFGEEMSRVMKTFVQYPPRKLQAS